MIRVRRAPRWAVPAALGVGLLFVPDSVRLTALAPLVPVRSAVDRATAWWPQGGGSAVELDFLKSRNQSLALENQELRSRLAVLTGARAGPAREAAALEVAPVILRGDAANARDSLVIGLGTRAGVRPGAWVLWEQHLVGVVAEAGPWTARVRLVTDPDFRAGAIVVPRPGEMPAAPTLAVVEGGGHGAVRLRWILDGEALPAQGYVVTAGDPDAGQPRGLILGKIVEASDGGWPYRSVVVRPDLALWRLPFVLVMVERG